MPTVTPTSRQTNSIDPNARSFSRTRRNWQRLQNQLTGAGITAASEPLTISGNTVSLNIDNLTLQTTTAGQLFATNILYNGVNNGSVSNSTTETFFPSFTPFVSPPSPVGSGVELSAYFGVQAGNANTDTLTIRTYYDGSLLFAVTGIPVGGSVAGTPMFLEERVLSTSTNTLQVTGTLWFNGIQEVIAIPITTVTAVLSVTPAINVSAQWSVASTADIITMANYVVCLIGAT